MRNRIIFAVIFSLLLLTLSATCRGSEVVISNSIKDLPTLPLKVIEEIKKKENFNLATGKTTISYKIDDEVGYGVTPHEVEDAIRQGVLPKTAKLPSKMTKSQADWWMENVTIPTYRSIVRKTVTVKLSLNEEASLVFFTQNQGGGNLRKLVTQPGRLNDGNHRSVVEIMPLYYAKYTKSHPGLVKRCRFQVALFEGKLSHDPTQHLAQR